MQKYYIWYEHKLHDNGPYSPIILEASNEEEASNKFKLQFPSFDVTEIELIVDEGR